MGTLGKNLIEESIFKALGLGDPLPQKRDLGDSQSSGPPPMLSTAKTGELHRGRGKKATRGKGKMVISAEKSISPRKKKKKKKSARIMRSTPTKFKEKS